MKGNTLKNMKILIISYEFPPLVGGAGTYSRELAVGLSKNNCDVSIITCHQGKRKQNHKSDQELLTRYGIHVYRFRSLWKFFFLQMHRKLIKHFTKDYHKQFDYIILSDSRATRYAILYMNDEQLVKSVNIFHGGEINSFYLTPNYRIKLSGIHKKFVDTLMKSKANITVSADFKKVFINEIPQLEKRMHVVLHGIDDKIFRPLSARDRTKVRNIFGIKNNETVILSASRLVAKKGQDKLIEAYAPLVVKYPRTKLVIAGDGEYRNELENLCSKFGINDHVLFTGQLLREELARLMAASDLFAMISRREAETFGLVYIEANACGIPVLAGRIAGVSEAVEDGVSGVLVNPYDTEDIKNKLEGMLDNKMLKYLGEKGYMRTKQYFTCTSMARKTLDILNS